MPSGISRMMIRAASRRATRPRKEPSRNPTGVRTSDKQHARADRAGDDIGGAADHHGDEGRRHELLAHERHDRRGRRKQRAAEAGEPGAEAEGQHVDPPCVDAERARHRGVLHDGARLQAERRAVVEPPQEQRSRTTQTAIKRSQ